MRHLFVDPVINLENTRASTYMHIYTNIKKSAHIHRYKQTHASNAGIAYSVYLVPAGTCMVNLWCCNLEAKWAKFERGVFLSVIRRTNF